MSNTYDLKPYRPPQLEPTVFIPPPEYDPDIVVFKKVPATVTKDVAFAIWCGKVINWFGRIVIWFSQVVFKQAPRGHKFIAAHIFGFVGRRRRGSRELACATCSHRKFDDNRFETCGAESCGCGNWRLASLKHKRRLSGYRCVIGRFDHGMVARWWYKRSRR